MDIAAANAAISQSQAQTSKNKLTGDLESFLTLLTTQLKHQDPLEPVDSTEFTAQLAQFANVEQSIATNANLEKLIGLTSANQSLTAITSYLGKYVEAVGNTTALVDGSADLVYSLPQQANAAAIKVENEGGVTVALLTAETTAGKHTYKWDGKDANGLQLPDGNYKFSIAAATEAGDPIEGQTYTVGIVDSADGSGNDGVRVSINGVVVPLVDVVAIKNSPPGAE